MGSYEIFYRSSDESIQSIIKVGTPSPLTSSRSSGRSSSPLIGIGDLISGVSTRPFGNHGEGTSGGEAKGEEYSEAFDSLQKPINKFLDKKTVEDFHTDSAGVSVESSASSLKQRLEDLPAPSEAIKLADRVAALDRRIRWESDFYLQLQGQVDRIEEQNESEVDSLTGVASVKSIKNLLHDEPETVKDPRARRRVKMCSSAPETTRLNGEAFEQPLSSEATRNLKNSIAKKFAERRPSKYLEPINVPVKEILRCNAPALCISDKKIAELLRRGSISAREEYIKKSGKLAGTTRPTGMIIKNLSSGSEEDCASHWLIRGGFSVPKFKTEGSKLDSSSVRFDGPATNDKSFTKDARMDRRIEDNRQERFPDHPRSSTSLIAAQNGKARLNENNASSGDFPSATGTGSLAKTSLQNSMDRLKTVLRDLEENFDDPRKFSVPKLEIESREYSRSVSLSSRADPGKRSLDTNALIRALSDVSIKQQSVGSIVPISSPRTSMAGSGSRRSMSSAKNPESQEPTTNRSKALRRSENSSARDKKIECTEGSSKSRSKMPISTREPNDGVLPKLQRNELRKIARGKIVAEENRDPAPDRSSQRVDAGSSPTKKSPEYRSSHSARIHSPETRKNRKPTTDDSSAGEKFSGPAVNGFPSFDNLAMNLVKPDRNKKLTNGPAAVSSEPGTSRNDRRVIRDRLSSRRTSGDGDILPRVLGHDSGSSDDRFKYLRQGIKLPCSRSGGSSSSEEEGGEFELKIMNPSVSGFESADRPRSEAKFKVHEDTDDASSPGSEAAFSIEKNDTRTASGILSRADSSAESNRTMSSSMESRIEGEKNALPDTRSYLVSPANRSTKRTGSSSQLTGSSSKTHSNGSPIPSVSSGSPGCKCDENARLACKNFTAGTLEELRSEVDRKLEGESVFAATSVVKRRTYSDVTAPRSEQNSKEEQMSFREKRPPVDQPEVSSSDEEFIEDAAANSSRTNLAGAGTSDSNLRRFGKALDRARTGSKISSSFPKLTRPPEENLAARRKSQDRSPFTISASTSAKSSAKLRVKNAIQEPSETVYKLRAHPSLLRLAGAGYEATATEIIESASCDPRVMVRHGNFVEKFVKKFSERRRLRKGNESRGERTEVLWENKECRGSADESSGSNVVEKSGRAFNRNGLWVEGLWAENRSGGELPGTKEQDIIDRYTIFLAKRDQHQRQFGEETFPPETPMNTAIIDDDCDIVPGCFCARMCTFFIGGNIHRRKRSTLFLRARSSKLRRF